MLPAGPEVVRCWRIPGAAGSWWTRCSARRGCFEVLVDTLVGEWLPAWRPRAKVKEVALPKFYWFDPGVLHAAFVRPWPSR
jgi:hypothetical protein